MCKDGSAPYFSSSLHCTSLKKRDGWISLYMSLHPWAELGWIGLGWGGGGGGSTVYKENRVEMKWPWQNRYGRKVKEKGADTLARKREEGKGTSGITANLSANGRKAGLVKSLRAVFWSNQRICQLLCMSFCLQWNMGENPGLWSLHKYFLFKGLTQSILSTRDIDLWRGCFHAARNSQIQDRRYSYVNKIKHVFSV